MLHRIDVNVVDMALHGVLVTDLVFPKPPLPNRPFAGFKPG